jgi:hypothetical protein
MITTKKKVVSNPSFYAGSINQKVSQFPIEPPPLKTSQKSNDLKQNNNNDISGQVYDDGEQDLLI